MKTSRVLAVIFFVGLYSALSYGAIDLNQLAKDMKSAVSLAKEGGELLVVEELVVPVMRDPEKLAGLLNLVGEEKLNLEIDHDLTSLVQDSVDVAFWNQQEAVGELTKLLSHPDKKVRTGALAILSAVGSKKEGESLPSGLVGALVETAKSDREDVVRYQALSTLSEIDVIQDVGLIKVVATGLKHQSDFVRRCSVETLGNIYFYYQPMTKELGEELANILRPVIADPCKWVRALALVQLYKLGPYAAPCLPEITAAFADQEEMVRHMAVATIVELKEAGRPAFPDLTKMLTDKSQAVRLAAAKALVEINLPEQTLPIFLRELDARYDLDKGPTVDSFCLVGAISYGFCLDEEKLLFDGEKFFLFLKGTALGENEPAVKRGAIKEIHHLIVFATGKPAAVGDNEELSDLEVEMIVSTIQIVMEAAYQRQPELLAEYLKFLGEISLNNTESEIRQLAIRAMADIDKDKLGAKEVMAALEEIVKNQTEDKALREAAKKSLRKIKRGRH